MKNDELFASIKAILGKPARRGRSVSASAARPERRSATHAVAHAAGGPAGSLVSSSADAIGSADAVLRALDEVLSDTTSNYRDSWLVTRPFEWPQTRPFDWQETPGLEWMPAGPPDWRDTAPLDDATVSAPAPFSPLPVAPISQPTPPLSAARSALLPPAPTVQQAQAPTSTERPLSRSRLALVGLVAFACAIYVLRDTVRDDAASPFASRSAGVVTSTGSADPDTLWAPRRASSPSASPLFATAAAAPTPAFGLPAIDLAKKAESVPSVSPLSGSTHARPRIGLVGEADDRATESLLGALRGDSKADLPSDVDGIVAADWPSALRALRQQPRVAVVRYDVLQAARRAPASMGLPPLEVLAPLAAEAICFVVRADSSLHAIHEIEDQPIDAGATRSSRALTAAGVYRQMFGRAMPTLPARPDSSAEAGLQRLRVSGANEVVVVMASTLKAWLAASPSAARDVRLLRLDARDATRRGLFAGFLPLAAEVGTLGRDGGGNNTSLGLMSFLVSERGSAATRAGHDRDMVAFAQTLCRRLAHLRASGGLWRTLPTSLQFDVGLPYSAPVQAVLTGCDTRPQAALPSRPGADPAARG